MLQLLSGPMPTPLCLPTWQHSLHRSGVPRGEGWSSTVVPKYFTLLPRPYRCLCLHTPTLAGSGAAAGLGPRGQERNCGGMQSRAGGRAAPGWRSLPTAIGAGLGPAMPPQTFLRTPVGGVPHSLGATGPAGKALAGKPQAMGSVPGPVTISHLGLKFSRAQHPQWGASAFKLLGAGSLPSSVLVQ